MRMRFMNFKEISKLLYKLFVVNNTRYGEQKNHSKYYMIRKKIGPLQIMQMLDKRESYLTYQEVDGQINWICFDFDLDKKIINHDKNNKIKYLNDVIVEAQKLCNYLRKENINYLAEFSGNRGIHIWVIMNNYISKEEGYYFARAAIKNIDNRNENINIDLFPKTHIVRPRGIGLGVKIPLSFHKASKKYSYFIKDFSNFQNEHNIWRDEINEEFIKAQVNILNSYELQDSNKIISWKDVNNGCLDLIHMYKKANQIQLKEKYELDEVLIKLSQCKYIKNLLLKYRDGMKEHERAIIVGLLLRISLNGDKEYGKKMLKQFFSRMPNYRENLTDKKLEKLKLYPIKHDYLKALYPEITCNCKCATDNRSPLELLDIDILEEDIFITDSEEINRIKDAQKKYTFLNDEVPLYYIINALKNVNSKFAVDICHKALVENVQIGEVYKFIRYEDKNNKDKTRILYSLNYIDKIITTYLTRVLNSLYFSFISNNSYGYRLTHNFFNNDIFYHWIRQWKIYQKKLLEVIDDKYFDNYYLIKLDISKFYDNIDLKRLEIKLYNGLDRKSQIVLKRMDEKDKKRYYNIVDNLINYCRNIGDSNKGVPQGPAFARYLAELYLMELDTFIEDRIDEQFEFYFRYVDDIYIIIENKEKGKKIFDSVSEYMKSQNMSINNKKVFLGTVKEFRISENIKEYFEDDKYTVSFVNANERIIPKAEIEKTVNKMYKMLKDGELGEINNSNLSFFLTQFKNNKLLNLKRKEILEYVMELKYGRGSLFRNFYSEYFSQIKLYEDIIINTQVDIEGLSRGGFLNELYKQSKGNQVNYIEFKSILSKLVEQMLYDYEKILLVLIMMQNQFYCITTFLKNVDIKYIYKAVQYNMGDKLTGTIFNRIYEDLKIELEIKEFLFKLYKVTFNSALNREQLKQLSILFVKTITEEINRDSHSKKNINIDDNFINNYYNLVCLYTTLYSIDEEKNISEVSSMWNNILLTLDNITKKNNGEKIKVDNHWMKVTDNLTLKDIDEKLINSLFIAGTRGELSIKEGVHDYEIYEKFITDLILFLFQIQSDDENLVDYSDKYKIEEVINNIVSEGKYLEWILKDKSTEMYPKNKLCLDDYICNNKIMLKKGNEILVRIKKEQIPSLIINYVKKNTEIIEEKQFGQEYICFIHQIDGSKYICIRELVKNVFDRQDCFEYINLLLEIYDKNIKLKQKLLGRDEIKCFDLFHDECWISKDNYEPLLVYSILDNNRIILKDTITTVEKNDEITFCKELLELFLRKDKRFFENHSFQNKYLRLGFNEKLFEKNLMRGEISLNKIQYLKLFSKEIINTLKDNQFYIEYLRFRSIIEFLKENDSLYKNNCYKVLEIYNALPENKKPHQKLLYNIANVEVKDDSLIELYKTVTNSINEFLSSLSTDKVDKSIIELLEDEIKHIYILIKEFDSSFDNMEKLKEFKLVNCNVSTELDSVLEEEEIVINVNDKIKIYIENQEGEQQVAVLDLDKKEIGIEKFSNKHIEKLKTRMLYLYIDNNRYLFIIVPLGLEKSIETIKDRSTDYFKRLKNGDKKKVIPICYRNNYEIINKIKTYTNYNTAVEVLKAHFYKMFGEDAIENRLVSWLQIFDSEYDKQVLIDILAKHNYVKQDDIESFETELKDFKNKDVVFFSLKNPADGNGLHRLLTYSSIFREYNIKNCIENVINKKSCSKLIVMIEVGITGGQTNKAFDYYLDFEEAKNTRRSKYWKNKTKEQVAEDENYYKFKDEDEYLEFRKKFNEFKEIVFVAVLSTKSYEEKIIKHFEKYYKLKVNSVISKRKLKNSEWRFGDIELYSDIRKQFESIVRNEDALKDKFIFKETDNKYYIENIKGDKINNCDMIVRLRSVPKLIFRLFTLEPKDHINPLFNKME